MIHSLNMGRVKWLLLLLLQVLELNPTNAQKVDSDSASNEWKPVKVESDCDLGKNIAPHGGNLGQTDVFPWLGVIKVHVHDKGVLQVALTGVVLVKRGHAVGNADDISRIPKFIFKQHSSAMFLAKTNSPWYCKVKDYMVHPEYDYATLNTIALVELDANLNYPMMPICWPSYSYNASRNLYAMGFQDDNMILEKKVFAMDYVGTGLCEEFYNRVGYKSQDVSTAPTHLVCGFAPHNRNSCVWDSGMVLASNTTGTWMLLGLGIHGPGCAAPARFIEMLPYQPWIDSAMGLNEMDDELLRRRRDTDAVADPNPLVIEKAERSTLFIRNANTEDICHSLHNELIFHETRKLFAPSQGGSVINKISLQDQSTSNIFCCKVKLKDEHKDTSEIYTIENNEEAEFKMTEEFKIIIPPDDAKNLNVGTLDWEPWIKAEDLKDNQPNKTKAFDTFVRLEFEDEAEIEIKVFRQRRIPAANENTNASQSAEINEPQFDENLNIKELKAFEDFSAEVRRRDAELEIKTNTSTEVDLKKKVKTTPRSVESNTKHSDPLYVGESYKDTESNVKYNKPLDMDLDHYDAVRLPENKLAVIVDRNSDIKHAEEELNYLTKTENRDKDVKNIPEINDDSTKNTKIENITSELSNYKSIKIGVTEEIEAPIKMADITEKSTLDTTKTSNDDNIDSVHNNPKESALFKGLISDAETLKCILQLIFIEALVVWITI